MKPSQAQTHALLKELDRLCSFHDSDRFGLPAKAAELYFGSLYQTVENWCLTLPPASLSWNGFNLYGDAASITEASRLKHDADTVPELKARIRSDAERISALTQATASKQGEPVYWEWRHQESNPHTVNFGQWSEWNRVEPRTRLHTVEDSLKEFRNLIASGQKYELRALYTAQPAPAKAEGECILNDAFLDELTAITGERSTSERIHRLITSWIKTAPPASLEPAPAARPMTEDQIWGNDGIMRANGIVGFKFDAVIRIVRVVEAFHRIGSQPTARAAPADFFVLDDDAKAMIVNSHHYTPDNIRALIERLKAFADPQKTDQAEWDNLDWRGFCNVLWRVMMGLACDLPAAPATVPAVPAEVPDGVWEALQRLIENGGSLGPASREDAVLVAAYRDRVKFMAAPAAAVPAVPEDVVKNAARYEWLKSKENLEQFGVGDWRGEELGWLIDDEADAAIDAAMALASAPTSADVKGGK